MIKKKEATKTPNRSKSRARKPKTGNETSLPSLFNAPDQDPDPDYEVDHEPFNDNLQSEFQHEEMRRTQNNILEIPILEETLRASKYFQDIFLEQIESATKIVFSFYKFRSDHLWISLLKINIFHLLKMIDPAQAELLENPGDKEAKLKIQKLNQNQNQNHDNNHVNVSEEDKRKKKKIQIPEQVFNQQNVEALIFFFTLRFQLEHSNSFRKIHLFGASLYQNSIGFIQSEAPEDQKRLQQGLDCVRDVLQNGIGRCTTLDGTGKNDIRWLIFPVMPEYPAVDLIAPTGMRGDNRGKFRGVVRPLLLVCKYVVPNVKVPTPELTVYVCDPSFDKDVSEVVVPNFLTFFNLAVTDKRNTKLQFLFEKTVILERKNEKYLSCMMVWFWKQILSSDFLQNQRTPTLMDFVCCCSKHLRTCVKCEQPFIETLMVLHAQILCSVFPVYIDHMTCARRVV